MKKNITIKESEKHFTIKLTKECMRELVSLVRLNIASQKEISVNEEQSVCLLSEIETAVDQAW